MTTNIVQIFFVYFCTKKRLL